MILTLIIEIFCYNKKSKVAKKVTKLGTLSLLMSKGPKDGSWERFEQNAKLFLSLMLLVIDIQFFIHCLVCMSYFIG